MKCKFDTIENSSSGFSIIPIEIKNNLPNIEVEVDTLKVPLLFDAGHFSSITLSPTIINKLNVKYTGDYITCYDIKGNKLKAKELILPKLSIGNFTLSGVRGQEEIFDENWVPPNTNGVIGLGILDQFKLIIDYRDSVVTFMPDSIFPKQYNIESWDKLNFDYNNYGISTSTKIDGKRHKLIWDTCAQFSKLKTNYKDSNNVIKKEGRYFLNALSFIIDNNNFGPFEFILMDLRLPFDGVIGYNFFARNLVYIDFEKKIMKIDKI